MDLSLNDRQRELIELAGRLGRECFAPRAAGYDSDAQFPHENYEDLHQHGLLGLCIPERFGGLGADYATYCLVGAEIGKHCGATALTYNMHTCTMMWSGNLADDLPMTPAQRERHERRRAGHYARVVEEGAIYAQPFSEGSAAAAGRAPFGTTARKVDGGWIMNGRKIFASLAGAARYYGILCTEDKGDEHPADLKDTLYLAVPCDADGFEVVGPWDPLGMRATVSRNIEMKEVFVSDDMQLMPRGVYHAAASSWPHMFLTLSPTYVGIAEAAYAFTVRYLRGETEGLPPIKRRMYPTKQVAVAEMLIKLEQIRALFLRTISEARYQPSKADRLRAYATQYTRRAPTICAVSRSGPVAVSRF